MTHFDYEKGTKMKVIMKNAKGIPVGTELIFEGISSHFCGLGMCVMVSGYGNRNFFMSINYLKPI